MQYSYITLMIQAENTKYFTQNINMINNNRVHCIILRLSDEEKAEQVKLRAEYVASVRNNLRSQLDNISIQEPDGSVVNLGDKYGKKGH